MPSFLRRRQVTLGIGAALVPELAMTAGAAVLVYPRHGGRIDALNGYVPALLRLALDRSGRRVDLRESPLSMAQSRVVLEMQKPNSPIDVMWTVTTQQRQNSLLAIRIPIERGLIGWRVALVRRVDLDRWRELTQLRELAKYSAGQKHDWPDAATLRNNGLRVETVGRYESLFSMLAVGRIDYFPRSVLEVVRELESRAELDLVIEPHICLHYPSTMYFFVSPSRVDLAAEITSGLERAQADGSFEHLFQQRFRECIDLLRLRERRIFELKNPSLPSDVPTERGWWMSPT